MATFVIRGGRALSGEFRPMGNKNAALPMLAAAVLADEPVELDNLPDILDVRNMLRILEDIGVRVEREGEHRVRLCARGLKKTALDTGLCGRVRGSILFAGPLAARHGAATIPPPGGDVIGRRRLDTHFDGLRAMGVAVKESQGAFLLRRGRQWHGAELLLDEASVTATENLMMAASLAPGETVIYNAACEPHVQDLGILLQKMGAQIDGLGTNRLRISGVERLHGAEHRIQPDHVELGSFLAAAAATGGDLRVRDLPDAVTMEILARAFARLGVRWKIRDGVLAMPGRQKLRPAHDIGGVLPKMEDGIWPAIPSDLMSVMLVLATRARGGMLFFEKLFESRMYFVDWLLMMGADIVQCDPHRVVVRGGTKLHGGRITSPDIRAGMALILAALCAEGESRILRAEMVDRGYEQVDARLRALGADIRREE